MSSSRGEELPDEDEVPPPAPSRDSSSSVAAASVPPASGVDDPDLQDESQDVEAAERLKNKGNDAFKRGDLERALLLYDHGITRARHKKRPEKPVEPPPPATPPVGSASAPPPATPPPVAPPPPADDPEDLLPDALSAFVTTSQLHCNAAFVLMAQKKWADATEYLDEAVRHQPEYGKAFYRRGVCHYEQGQWSSCGSDLDKAEKLGIPLDSEWRVKRAEAKKKAEEEVAKMWGQLKDLGNMFLGKFGLSTDNFKMVQDPKTGSYSVNFSNGGAGAAPPPPPPSDS